MMKIGVLVNDKGISNIDMRHPENGNPGIGGTLYCFISLLYFLTMYGNQELTVFHYEESNLLPEGSDAVLITSPYDSLKEVKKRNLMLLLHEQMYGYSDWYQEIERQNVDTILWAHNYLYRDELIQVPSCRNVRRVVFVGREEYDYYMDHDVIKKSVFIYNICEDKKLRNLERKWDGKPTVTYVGSLVKVKGFHLLAKEWKHILRQVPDAQLEVLGTGKLYDRTCRLGKYGIAEESYESQFMKYLTDSNGNVLESVHFEGIVGDRKDEIFSRTTVGVVNPSAKSETFCLSAVEMEMAGIPVVTKGKHGLLDTVQHKGTGLLFHFNRQMRKYLILMLKNKELNHNMGMQAREFVCEKFNPVELTERWDRLILDILNETPIQWIPSSENQMNDLKWLKYWNRTVRRVIPVLPAISKIRRDIVYCLGCITGRKSWKKV